MTDTPKPWRLYRAEIPNPLVGVFPPPPCVVWIVAVSMEDAGRMVPVAELIEHRPGRVLVDRGTTP